jgi:protease I
MADNLHGIKVAILATEGVEQAELIEPRKALQNAGAQTDIISPAAGKIRAWNLKEWGEEIAVDQALDTADANRYDALLLPGGVMNPDKLRMVPSAVAFARNFFESGKPVAAICHGPWLLVEADVVRGLTLTSWPSLRTDIRNAGGNWVDREVVVDGGVVTSRKPDDIPAFNAKMMEEFARGAASGERRVA